MPHDAPDTAGDASLHDRPTIVSLVLADGYPILLEGMAHVFATEPGFIVLACCGTASDTARAVQRHRPDVLVLDFDIPGDAMTVVRAVAAERAATRVVLVASKVNDRDMLDAMRLGAKGILLKSMPRHLLVRCVRHVHGGATWLEKAAITRTIEQLLHHAAPERDLLSRLTRRELEIVRMVAEARSTKEIAETLSVSRGTIKVHVHHIYEKLGIRGRLELTLFARERGLLPPAFQPRPIVRQ